MELEEEMHGARGGDTQSRARGSTNKTEAACLIELGAVSHGEAVLGAEHGEARIRPRRCARWISGAGDPARDPEPMALDLASGSSNLEAEQHSGAWE